MSDDVERPGQGGVPPGSGRTPPLRRVGRRPVTEEAGREYAAVMSRPGASGEAESFLIAEELPPEHVDPLAQRRSERIVGWLFLLSVAGTLMFLIGYATIGLNSRNLGKTSNYILGAGMTLAMLGVGAGMIVWAKRLLPHAHGIGEREPHYSPEPEELATEELFNKGVQETGIARRPFIRRTMIAALGLLPLPAVVALRDMGPLPKARLQHTSWFAGSRLISLDSGLPVRLGDVPIGGIVTVMPEGHTDPDLNALSPTVLIRLPPGVNRPPDAERAAWAPFDHVAYSKICTHAGCPVPLYEQQTHRMLCPCHQSTFDVPHACKVIFGPASRPLPQLPLTVDPDGYFRARRDFTTPVGPTYWERG